MAQMTGFLDAPPMPAPIVITEDKGGIVDQYSWAAARYKLQNRRVEIRGSCRSACLLALSVPKVCVTDRSVVKAHHAYEKATGVIRYDITKQMLDALPPRIRRALDGKIEKEYSAQATLGYAELRLLGVPDCSPENANTQAAASPLLIRRPDDPVAHTIRPGALLKRAALRVARTPLAFLIWLVGSSSPTDRI